LSVGPGNLGAMSAGLPPSLRSLAELQRGVVTTVQATDAGLIRDLLKSRVNARSVAAAASRCHA
jgi:hypothetical protein